MRHPQENRQRSQLRLRAEQILSEKSAELDTSWFDELGDLFHELQVREMEIELQNEALRVAHHQLEILRNKYEDLYQLAPVGYFTLDETGRIVEVNRTGAALLGLQPDALIGELFIPFVAPEDQQAFYLYHKTLKDLQVVQSEELRVQRANRSRFYAHLEGIRVEDTEAHAVHCRIAVHDVTLRRQENLIETLLKAGHYLTNTVGLSDLLSLFVEAVIDTLPSAEAAILWLYNEDDNTLVASVWAGYAGNDLKGLTVPANKGLLGAIFQSGAARKINDASAELAFVPLGTAFHDSMQSGIGIPLHFSDQAVGVLFAYNFTVTELFSDNDLFLMEALANQMALVIQNARLFEEINTAREQARFLARQVVTAQENERRRVARELHDEAGQALTVLKLALQTVQDKVLEDVEAACIDLDSSITLVDQTIERIRNLSYTLRPPVLDMVDLNTVLHSHCKEFAARTLIPVEYEGITLPALSEAIKITLYRFLQEALTNVARHAHAKTIRVQVNQSGRSIMVVVEDDGDGFDSDTVVTNAVEPRGIGLLGIRERFEAVGGEFEIHSVIGDGTRLVARVPLDGAGT